MAYTWVLWRVSFVHYYHAYLRAELTTNGVDQPSTVVIPIDTTESYPINLVKQKGFSVTWPSMDEFGK